MIPFDPSDPFPLLEAGHHDYADAQAHSSLVDAWLGLRTEETERKISQRNLENQGGGQLWVGLPVRTLLTPYTEIREALERVRVARMLSVVDLGAGYGRIGFVIHRHFPNLEFTGYEYLRERVDEGNRALQAFDSTRAKLVEADLSDAHFKPPVADLYFIYDYGSRAAIAKTLEDLRQIARHRPLTLVGRGRATRDAIEREHPWLSQVCPPEHCGNFSIYRSGV